MGKVHLQFEPNLEYQRQAIEAACGLFKGAERGSRTFSVVLPGKGVTLGLTTSAEQNYLDAALSTQQIERNMREVQEKNGVERGEHCTTLDFTVEMETGTGKTYVYLRTIYELNKRYGFKKFVIVVPTIAIKAGVEKSLELMREHFHKLYDGVAMESFVYEGKRVESIRDFCTSDKLQIMVCTIQSITEVALNPENVGRKGQRVLHNRHEAMGGDKPIEYIQKCRPIVIVDEPQMIGEKGEGKGIAELHPLCTLRYSATHKNLLHPIYRLTAVDAAQQKLVKKIEVASVLTDGAATAHPFIRVLGTMKKKGGLAKLEMRVRKKEGGYKEKVYEMAPGTMLSMFAEGWDAYDDFVLQEVHEDGSVLLTRRGGEFFLHKGEEWTENAGQNREMWERIMVRTTIEEHLRKEVLLRPKGIKVLSLFFIDRVADYRDGKEKGWLAQMFEEEYQAAMQDAKYRSLYEDRVPEPSEVHGGYFAIDKKKKGATGDEEYWIDTEGKGKEMREAEARAYNLIMRDKEKLLSLEEPLKFIFSHSALREGWDNPNVFQVCILRDIKSTMSRRQALGRGLRICVDQSGRRVREEGVTNTLTVISREEFSEYAAGLQKEYEQDGICFGALDVGKLGLVTYTDAQGKQQQIGQDAAKMVKEDLVGKGLLVGNRPTVELRKMLDAGQYTPPAVVCEEAVGPVLGYLKKLARPIEIENARERRVAHSQYSKYRENKDFIELWNRIKKKTTYRVTFDTDNLVKEVLRKLDGDNGLCRIDTPMYWVVKTGLEMDDTGVQGGDGQRRIRNLDLHDIPVPDIITALEEDTHLTRKTLCRILQGTEHLHKLRENAAEFERIVTREIKAALQDLMVEGISYVPVTIGDTEYSAQELFKDEEGYKDRMVECLSKCLTDHVIFNSEIEKRFALEAEAQEEVKLFTKLPPSFTVNTPIGKYNPDWAIVIEKKGQPHLYFVVETKGTDTLDGELRGREGDKIRCARKHFDAVGANFEAPVDSLDNLLKRETRSLTIYD